MSLSHRITTLANRLDLLRKDMEGTAARLLSRAADLERSTMPAKK
jgi:hypothetical protein